tara:strand:+ start:1259 stop:3337 length:2079 start_codon:yes stop_codon:yes gene_type:complete
MNKVKIKFSDWRIILIYFLAFIISTTVVAKIINIQQFEPPINTTSQPKFEFVVAPRGNILSDNGSILAISMPLYKVHIDMTVIDEDLLNTYIDEISVGLSQIFKDTTASFYKKKLITGKKKKNKYLKLKSRVDHNQLRDLRSLPIFKLDRYKGGLIAESRPNRELPFGQLAQRTIGRLQDYGTVGIERAYNQILLGEPGLQFKRKLKRGVWIPEEHPNNLDPKPGKDIQTTINIDMQDVAHELLANTLAKENADWGCVVLMEVKTGNVKVIVNLSKDSNDIVRESYNYAIGSHVAPGSTFKLASILALIDDRKIDLNDQVDLEKGTYRYSNLIMKDSPHNYNKVSIQKAFEISSNIGISKLVYKSYFNDPNKFISKLRDFGFYSPLDIELMYPSYLKMPDPNNKKTWSGTSLPWMSIGYEMSLTPLHILTFYNAVANNGKMMLPIFSTDILKDGKTVIKKKPKILSSSICSKTSISQVLNLLEGVVENGTAKNIYTDQYKIAGKTGTSVTNYVDKNKEDYIKKYRASFVGFFPADKPKYSCIVVVDNPKNGQVYGSKVAAPIFRDLADKVFATDMSLHEPIKSKKNIKYQQEIKIGSISKLKLLKKEIDLTEARLKNIEKDYIKINHSLKNNIMPFIKGMSARDAIYILENNGFRVSVEGSGSVIQVTDKYEKKIAVGQKLVQGSLIKIILA